MLEKYLLRLILQNSFWEQNSHKVLKEFFPDNFGKLYELIVKHQGKYHKDISLKELKALYQVTYPATTRAQWDLLEQIIDDLPTEVNEDAAKEILQKAWVLEQGRRLTQIGADIINGKEANFAQVREILKAVDEGTVLDGSDLQQISDELEDILAEVNTTTKWAFNLAPLRTVASGIGPGIFTIVAARVETGKTAFGISISAGPNGLASQGAKVHLYCNEEAPMRTQVRAVMAYTGMSLQEILLHKDKAKRMYADVKENLKFFDCRGRGIEDLEQHIARNNPDACIVDQLDKLSIRGTFAREDERLGSLYVAARDIGNKYGTSMVALTQLSADSEGKTYVSSANLANSRTSKAAEGDLVLGIGKGAAHIENTRIINIIKNKQTGKHNDVVCMIQPEISRYVA